MSTLSSTQFVKVDKIFRERVSYDWRNKNPKELLHPLMSEEEKVTVLELSSFHPNGYFRENVIKALSNMETENTNDSKIIFEFINSDIIQIVKATINALARLNLQEYKENIIFILNDSRSGISKSAKLALYKEINISDAEKIYGIFKESMYDHVKINTCVLLCSLSKWDSIRYIIEFCADKNNRISTLGQYALERWKSKYNRSFTTRTKNQITEIRKSMDKFGDLIENSAKEFIEFSIKGF